MYNEIDKLITFETAKLAKEKGFDYNSPYFYMSYNKENPDWKLKHQYSTGCVLNNLEPVSNNFFDMLLTENISGAYYIYSYAISVPTQTLLARWIRKNYGIHVEIYCNTSGFGYILTKLNGTVIKEITDDIFFTSNEDALEVGLQLALTEKRIV